MKWKLLYDDLLMLVKAVVAFCIGLFGVVLVCIGATKIFNKYPRAGDVLTWIFCLLVAAGVVMLLYEKILILRNRYSGK